MQVLSAFVVFFNVFDPAEVVELMEELIHVEAVYTIPIAMRRSNITDITAEMAFVVPLDLEFIREIVWEKGVIKVVDFVRSFEIG